MDASREVVGLTSNSHMPIVVGIGGAGCSIVQNLFWSGYDPSRLLCLNTRSALLVQERRALGLTTLSLDDDGLDACNAKLRLDQLLNGAPVFNAVKNSRALVIVAGLGGYAGTTYAPLLATWARGNQVFSMAFVTLPLTVEGVMRGIIARHGLQTLDAVADGVMTCSLDHIVATVGKDKAVSQVLRMADVQIRDDIQRLILSMRDHDDELLPIISRPLQGGHTEASQGSDMN